MSEEYCKEEFLISTNKMKIQTDIVYSFLTKSYWAEGISFDTVKKSIKNSMCFGVYHNNKQIGFARVITDYTRLAYLCDIFIIEEYRGRRLSKWLMETILSHSKLKNIKSWMLSTKDAHGLYEKFGFKIPEDPKRVMRLSK